MREHGGLRPRVGSPRAGATLFLMVLPEINQAAMAWGLRKTTPRFTSNCRTVAAPRGEHGASSREDEGVYRGVTSSTGGSALGAGPGPLGAALRRPPAGRPGPAHRLGGLGPGASRDGPRGAVTRRGACATGEGSVVCDARLRVRGRLLPARRTAGWAAAAATLRAPEAPAGFDGPAPAPEARLRPGRPPVPPQPPPTSPSPRWARVTWGMHEA